MGLVTLGLVFATAIYYPFSPAARQARNMRNAKALLPPIRQTLQSDTRFGKVELDVYTGYEGSVIVYGEVASAQDLAALRQIVAARAIPYHVQWSVDVGSSSTMPSTLSVP